MADLYFIDSGYLDSGYFSVTYNADSQDSSTFTLSATGGVTSTVTVALTSAFTQTAAPKLTVSISKDLTSQVTFVASGVIFKDANCVVSSWATQTVTGSLIKTSTANLSSAFTQTSTGLLKKYGIASLTTTTTQTATAVETLRAALTLSGVFTQTASAFLITRDYFGVNALIYAQPANAFYTDTSGNFYVQYGSISNWSDGLNVTKYNASGTLIWANTYSPLTNSVDTDATFVVDSQGYIYIAGIDPYSTNVSFFDTWLVKISPSDGSVVWKKYFASQTGARQISTYGVQTKALKIDSADNIYMFGSGYVGYPFAGIWNVYERVGAATKWDTSGNLIWKYAFTDGLAGSGAYNSISFGNAELATDGTAWVATLSSYNSNTSTQLYPIFYFTVSGTTNTLAWQKKISTAEETFVSLDTSKNALVAYNGTGNKLTVDKVSPSGTVSWTKGWTTVPTDWTRPIDVEVDSNNNTYILGYGTETSSGYIFSTITKLDSSGNLLWAAQVKRNVTGTTYQKIDYRNLRVDADYLYLSGIGYINGNNKSILLKIRADGSELGTNIGPGGYWTLSSVSGTWASKTTQLSAITTFEGSSGVTWVSGNAATLTVNSLTSSDVGNYTLTTISAPVIHSGAAALTSAFTQTASLSKVLQSSASLTGTFTQTASGSYRLYGQSSLSTSATLEAAGSYRQLGSATLSAAFTQEAAGNFTFNVSKALTSTATQTVTGELIKNGTSSQTANFYQITSGVSMAPVESGTITCTANFTQSSTGGIVYQLDSNTTSNFTLTADGFNVLVAQVDLSSAFTVAATSRLLKEISMFADSFASLSCAGQLSTDTAVALTASFSIYAFGQTKPPLSAEAALTSNFTLTGYGEKVIENQSFITANFYQITTGVSMAPVESGSITSTGVFTQVASGVSIGAVNGESSLTSQFFIESTGSVARTASSNLGCNFTLTATGRESSIRGTAELYAYYTQHARGTLQPKQDIRLTIGVPRETNNFTVLKESRLAQVCSENRTGNVLKESRLSIVENENRINILL